MNSTQNNQVKISIFVALSSCSCNYENWLNRVFDILMPYKDKIDFEVKDATGWESYKYNILQNTIMVEESEEDVVKNRIFFTEIDKFQEYIACF